MKIKDYIDLGWMRIKGVKGPLRNAKKYRRKGLKIGENTYIYRNVHIDLTKGAHISIGKNCCLTGCVILAHDACLNKTYNKKTICKPVIIGDDSFIGFNSTVLMGVNIGKNVIVGAGAVVVKDVPDGCVVAGNPAKIIMKTSELYQKRYQE